MSLDEIALLTDPKYLAGLAELPLQTIRERRSACQDAEEVLSLRRRLVQGRLDIVQSELCRRANPNTSTDESTNLVDELPEILLERGDRHLGPGRLTRLDPNSERLGDDFEVFIDELDKLASGAVLSDLKRFDDDEIRGIADELDRREREISQTRHKLHANIDRFQEELVRRYKSGEASVDGLLAES